MAFSSPPPSPVLEALEQLLPLFALAAFLVIIIRSASFRRRAGRSNYRREPVVVEFRPSFPPDFVREAEQRTFSKKRIFNASERKLHRVLCDEVDQSTRNLCVMGQVHLAEIIKTDHKKKKNGNYFIIGNKRLDFLLVDESANPVLAVEYHGGGHYGANVAKYDKIKSIVLGKAGIPLLVVKENEPESSIRQSVKAILGG